MRNVILQLGTLAITSIEPSYCVTVYMKGGNPTLWAGLVQED